MREMEKREQGQENYNYQKEKIWRRKGGDRGRERRRWRRRNKRWVIERERRTVEDRRSIFSPLGDLNDNEATRTRTHTHAHTLIYISIANARRLILPQHLQNRHTDHHTVCCTSESV